MTEESPLCVELHFSRQCDLVRKNSKRKSVSWNNEALIGFLQKSGHPGYLPLLPRLYLDDIRAPPPCRVGSVTFGCMCWSLICGSMKNREKLVCEYQ